MATGAQEHIDTLTGAAFIKEVWSKEALVARESELLFAAQVNRVFEKELAMGDTLHVNSVTNLTAQTKSMTSNSAIVFETQTETPTDIVVNRWEYQAIAIETATKVQVDRDMLALYAPKQGYALALAVDDILAGMVDDLTYSVGALAAPIEYDEVLRAQQYLDDAEAPMENRYINISPAQKKEFLLLDHFINKDYGKLTSNSLPLKDRARLGMWMDVPVSVSTNVEGDNTAGHDNAFYQKEALALVMQMSPTTHTDFDIDYFCWKVAVEQLSGTKEMWGTFGVWMKGM